MKQLNESNEKLCFQLFKLSYGLFLTYSLLGHVDIFATVLKIGTILAIILFFFNFLLQYERVSISVFLGYLLLIAFSLLQSYHSNDFGLFKLAVFAGSVRTLKFKDIIRFDMYLRGILILLVVTLCQLGIVPDVLTQYEDMYRHSLGFTNSNTLGIAVFIWVCDMIYVRDFKLNWKQFAIIVGIAVWLFAIARSRTAVYGIVAITAVALFYGFRPKWFSGSFFKILCYLAPVVCALLSWIVTEAYMDRAQWAIDINKETSNRVAIIANFATILSPKWLGQPIGDTWSRSLDNTYAFVLYDLGIWVFILFIVAIIGAVKRNFKCDVPLCLILCLFSFYGLSEHLWINVDYNIFMLALCYTPVREAEVDIKRENSKVINRFSRQPLNFSRQ